MARLADQQIAITDLRGGSNSADPPLWLNDTQCIEAMNIDWWLGTIGRKRPGSTAIGTTFSAGGPFAGQIAALVRHTPTFDESAAEQWAFDTTGLIARQAGAATWAQITPADAISGNTYEINGVSLAGKLWLCYDSTENRLHVWDPTTSTLRRVGLATPAAPTAATMGGAGLTFTRHYAVRWVDISGSDYRRRSERGASVSLSIVDDAGITVTRPTAPSEGETHWELYASDSGSAPWYLLATTVIATTTVNDTNATIPTTTADVDDGINYPPPSARWIRALNSRLVMAGAFETSGGYVTPKDNRVWWTAVIGANDVGDLERIPSGFYADVSFGITALSPPFQGSIFIFGYTHIAKLVPTGLPGANAFQVVDVSLNIGCVRHHSIAMGVDEAGNQCIYFYSNNGPYRLSVNGLQYLGNDREDVWGRVNLDAATVVVHSTYYTARHQWWVWVTVDFGSTPTVTMVFDSRLGQAKEDAVVGGWSRADGTRGTANCSCLMPESVASAMSRKLVPWFGIVGVTGKILRGDESATTDDSTPYQAYITTKDYAPAGLGQAVEIIERFLLAGATSTLTTIQCTVIREADAVTTGFSTISTTSTLVSAGTRVLRKFETGELAGGAFYRFTLGDASANSATWTLDAFVAKYRVQEPL